jgi:5-(carboxyamino)imidazole ribonucleotide synthase
MKNYLDNDFKLGILGGGQLGKMLCKETNEWSINTHILDSSASFPAAANAGTFVEGNYKDFDDVVAFGKDKDVITIEIEHVNVEALEVLEKEGVIVHPRPGALKIIKDKGLQKQFYAEHDFPSSPFQLFDNKEAIIKAHDQGLISIPFVQKSRTAGYDGKGVFVVNTIEKLEQVMDCPSVIEDLVDINKELAVIAVRNTKGEVNTFPVVEMEFHPTANLVEFLLSPAKVDTITEEKCKVLATELIEAYDICGLLAVEFFLTNAGEVLINEVAPRPHNSGHHTIESSSSSQFEQHIRGILNMPLGELEMLSPAVMINLLGDKDYTGPAVYEGFEDCIAVSRVYPHIYGKTLTKPYRKMGHITITDSDRDQAKAKAKSIKSKIRVIAK